MPLPMHLVTILVTHALHVEPCIRHVEPQVRQYHMSCVFNSNKPFFFFLPFTHDISCHAQYFSIMPVNKW